MITSQDYYEEQQEAEYNQLLNEQNTINYE